MEKIVPLHIAPIEAVLHGCPRRRCSYSPSLLCRLSRCADIAPRLRNTRRWHGIVGAEKTSPCRSSPATGRNYELLMPWGGATGYYDIKPLLRLRPALPFRQKLVAAVG